MDDLSEEAGLWGVEKGYFDVFGRWHEPTTETRRHLIAALSRGRAGPAESIGAGDTVRAFQGDGQRYWLLAVQLYALRSRRNWGHGDFGDLARLIPIASARGAAGIGLNPLHALFPDRAREASPYAPNSRHFLNLLYIDIDAIPEFPGSSRATFKLDAMRSGDLIDYDEVARAKCAALRVAYSYFAASPRRDRRTDFDDFRRQLGEPLRDFAAFEVLRARFASSAWPDWPKPWSRPSRKDLAELRASSDAECEFHEFVQWIADRQLRECKAIARRSGMPVGLYLDMAVGIHPHGADAWSRQDGVLSDVSIGAPPDEFNPDGQNWGLAPFNPCALAADDFALLRALMRSVMRHAGAIRIDHVLGLQRLFMIPRGSGAADGAYVRFPFEPSLHAIAEESEAARCIVIGEDLGTVPEGFRETIARWGLWSYRVILFERDGSGRFHPPENYPAESLATFNTHDLPPLRAWLASHDLRIRKALGMRSGEQHDARAWAHECLRAIFRERAPAFANDELSAVACFLAQTPSRLVTVALDDVLEVLEQINIPGTVDEHPNWRRRLPVALEELEDHAGLRRVADAFAQYGRRTR